LVTTSNLTEAAFELCKWANADPVGRLRPLVLFAVRERPNSAKLKELVAELPAELG